MDVGSSEKKKKSGNRKLLEIQIDEREQRMPQSRICTNRGPQEAESSTMPDADLSARLHSENQ